MNFANAAKAATGATNAGSMGLDVSKHLATFDNHLQFAIRQFDVGFFNPAEPEVPPVAGNSITIGNMMGSTIQQGSPGAKQQVEINLEIQTIKNSLDAFESAIAGSSLPRPKVDELMADVHTIRAQLAKPSPSGVIVREAGKSLRNVLEGIAGGMLTPAATAAAAALWSALGLG